MSIKNPRKICGRGIWGHPKLTARADSFNLVITDLSMPDMGGLLLIERIFALRPRMPAILTTGYSEAMTLGKAQQAGIAALLMKPHNKTDLSASISHVLSD